jgi:tetratricopeptide (TPR) repeat protein
MISFVPGRVGRRILKKLPDYREKQKILYIDRQSDKDLLAYGDSYLESGRISDATDFYQKANHLPGLEKIREMAEAIGDTMAFLYVLKALKRNPTEDDWNRVGQRALELKKYTFALHSFQKSNNRVKTEEVKNMMALEDHL